MLCCCCAILFVCLELLNKLTLYLKGTVPCGVAHPTPRHGALQRCAVQVQCSAAQRDASRRDTAQHDSTRHDTEQHHIASHDAARRVTLADGATETRRGGARDRTEKGVGRGAGSVGVRWSPDARTIGEAKALRCAAAPWGQGAGAQHRREHRFGIIGNGRQDVVAVRQYSSGG